MDRWDILIIAAAAYVAVMTLVRLMTARRNHLVDHVRQQVEQQREQQKRAQPSTAEETDQNDRGAA